ncbi:hypothetical protein [Streptomyces griseorubiginosus]|uniref:hypothetical protein n=1 Tax=Streptomyces griseorubiginosus TaxID=67304 RepID=UPI0011402E86|nr:hypothetical protein [Streptomyces griseorubiginosus]
MSNRMGLELDPPRSVGGISIGMPIEAAERVLEQLPGFVPPAPGERRNRGFAHYESGLSISLDFDHRGVVRAVELFRPERDVQVLFQGISVFEQSADDVIAGLADRHRTTVEDDGLNITAPDVFIGFWRSVRPVGLDDENGRFFDSVLVAAPGYGD